MSLREWLIAIGSLIVLGVVIDGIRRMRRARKESVAISSGMGADEIGEKSPLDDEYNPELPNGGARTISRDTLEERGYVKPERKSLTRTPTKPTRPIVSAESETKSEGTLDEQTQEGFGEEFSARYESDDFEPETGWGTDEEDRTDFSGNDEIVGSARVVGPENASTSAGGVEDSTAEQEPPSAYSSPGKAPDVQQDTASRAAASGAGNQPKAGANRPEAREVVVINVLAKNGEKFPGDKLKALFDACGLEHGDLDIYHRHEESDTQSPVQFSVASAVEPGTFNPQDQNTFNTPGISFFMSMPGPTNSLQAFEFMLETAQCVVRNLGGELKDERRSVMTPQTIEHCRQRIREFERKSRSSA